MSENSDPGKWGGTTTPGSKEGKPFSKHRGVVLSPLVLKKEYPDPGIVGWCYHPWSIASLLRIKVGVVVPPHDAG